MIAADQADGHRKSSENVESKGIFGYNSGQSQMTDYSGERGAAAVGNVADVVKRCLSYEDEMTWFEYKKGTALSNVDEIGEYVSALSNAAAMCGEPNGYLIWGIHDVTHEITGTKFSYTRDVNHEPFEHRLDRIITPKLNFKFEEDTIEGHRVVLLTIPAAKVVPTACNDERYIRIGSSKESVKKHPESEAELF